MPNSTVTPGIPGKKEKVTSQTSLRTSSTRNADRVAQGASSSGSSPTPSGSAPRYGKYRGTIVNNQDPEARGRIQALVPSISDRPLGWALPNAPFAGPKVGFLAVPPLGANVWIEFEEGNPASPIWTGGFWEAGEAPAYSNAVIFKSNEPIKIQNAQQASRSHQPQSR